MTIEERNQFLTDNYGLLMHYARMFEEKVADVDLDESLELVYDAALKACDRWNPEKSSFPNFLHICVRGVFLNRLLYRIAKKRSDALSVSYEELVETNSLVRDEWGRYAYEDMTTSAYVKELLSCLTDAELYIVKSYYWDGFDCVEIGKTLGHSKQAVHQRLMKALGKMRKKGDY